jgi:arginine N-succinyltransferase
MIHAQHGDYDEPHVFFRVIQEERYADLRVTRPDDRIPRRAHDPHDAATSARPTTARPSSAASSSTPNCAATRTSSAASSRSPASSSSPAFRALVVPRPPARGAACHPSTQGPSGDHPLARCGTPSATSFTGLSYDEADRLSRTSIKSSSGACSRRCRCTPACSPSPCSEIIGQVGPNTVGAQRLLESIGFQYSGRVDPFDGGPHYRGRHRSRSRSSATARSYQPVAGVPDATAQPGIVALVSERSPHFRAVWTPMQAIQPDEDPAPTPRRPRPPGRLHPPRHHPGRPRPRRPPPAAPPQRQHEPHVPHRPRPDRLPAQQIN